MAQTSGASPSAQKPFFRYDLQTTALEENGHRYVDVSCPDTGSSFRFFEVEYAVACGMDGERDLEQLVDWAQAELDLRTNTKEVGAILSKLSELNFVEGAEAGAAVEAATAKPAASAPEEIQKPAATEPAPSAPAPAPLAAQGSELAHEVELGHSGRSPLAHERPAPPAVAEELELGLAGASASSPPAKKPAESGIELGAAGFETSDDFEGPSKEVSTDLSQTFRIDKGDVQAAVRASKVMSAVDIPEDLKEEMAKLEASDAKPASAEKPADLASQIGEEVQPEAGAEAIVLPEEPAKVAKREAAEARAEKAVAGAEKAEKSEKKKEPAKARRSAPILLWLVLLLAVGAGAAYYYLEYVREQPETEGAAAALRAQQAQQQVDPPAPEPPVGKLVVGEAPVSEAKASVAGIVAEVVAPGTEVAAGDVLVKLKGFERHEREIARHTTSRDQYSTRLEAAKSRDDANKVAQLERDVARKTKDIATATAKRDAYFIKAEMGGVVEALVEVRARVAIDQPVAKVSGQASATVEFQLPPGMSASPGEERSIVDLSDPELTATCTVEEAAGQAILLSCPADSGLAADADVKLVL